MSRPVPVPEPFPKDRPRLSLPELIDRYRNAGVEEAPGIIRAIAQHGGASVITTRFLASVGDEADIREPDSLLRKEARTMLARKVLPELLKYPVTIFRDLTDEMRQMVKMAVEFFAKDENHAEHLPERERTTLQGFLGRCWRINESLYAFPATQCGDFDKEPLCAKDDLIKALVYARHFEYILNERIFRAEPFLYSCLLSRYSESADRRAPYKPRSVWLQGKYAGDKPESISTQEARLIRQDLMCITVVCGYALDSRVGSFISGFAPYAKTLLQLVAMDLAYFKYSFLPRG